MPDLSPSVMSDTYSPTGATDITAKLPVQTHREFFFTEIYTDIQLKALKRSLEVFNMKIIMRRDFVIFYYKITKSAAPPGGVFQIKLK